MLGAHLVAETHTCEGSIVSSPPAHYPHNSSSENKEGAYMLIADRWRMIELAASCLPEPSFHLSPSQNMTGSPAPNDQFRN